MLRTYIEHFNKDTNVDAFHGRTRWSPERYLHNPFLMLEGLMYEVFHKVVSHQHPRRPQGGPNFAVKASTFAAIGGYTEFAHVSEDILMSHKLVAFREGSDRFIPFKHIAAGAAAYTSTRRLEAALKNNISCDKQWISESTGFTNHDPSIRNPRSLHSLPRPIPFTRYQFLRAVSKILRRSFRDFSMGPTKIERLDTYIPLVLRKLGVESHVKQNPCRLSVTAVDGLYDFLNETPSDRFLRNLHDLEALVVPKP